MSTQPVGGKAARERELQRLEANLEAALQPVALRPEFVEDLRSRLLSGSDIQVSRHQAQDSSASIWTALGLLSGVLLLILGVRGLLGLLETHGVTQQFKQNLETRRAARLNPVT